MTQMTKGANIPVTVPLVRATLFWSGGDGVPDVDASAVLLQANGRVSSDADLVFYNQPTHVTGAVKHAGKTTGALSHDVIDLNLGGMPETVERIALAASADGGTFGQVPGLRLVVSDLSTGTALAEFAMTADTETAFVTGELYRRAGGWKFRAVGQGFSTGLAGLAAEFGIDVGGGDAPAAEPAPAPEPEPVVAPPAPTLPPPSFDLAPPAAPPAPEPTPAAASEPAASLDLTPPAQPAPTLDLAPPAPPPSFAPPADAQAPSLDLAPPAPPPSFAPPVEGPPAAPVPWPGAPAPDGAPSAAPTGAPVPPDAPPLPPLAPPVPPAAAPAPPMSSPAPPAWGAPAAGSTPQPDWSAPPAAVPAAYGGPAAEDDDDDEQAPGFTVAPPPTIALPARTLDAGPVTLSKNERVTLSSSAAGPLTRIMLDLSWIPAPGRLSVDLDASVIAFDASGKKLEIVWYQHQSEFSGALQHTGDAKGEGTAAAIERVLVDLPRLPDNVAALVFTITSFHGHTFTDLQQASVLLSDDAGRPIVTYDLVDTQPSTAVLMAIIRRIGPGEWQMRAIGEYHDFRTVKKLVDPAARHVGIY